MSKKPVKIATPDSKEVVRATFRLHGAELEQVREVQEMLSLNSELDAARYLMQRGLEAMSAMLASKRTHAHMRKQVTTDAIIQAMFDKGFSPEELKG